MPLIRIDIFRGKPPEYRVLVALTATSESAAGYDHAWIAQAATGVLAAGALLGGARTIIPTTPNT
jgi:hypothetical protein